MMIETEATVSCPTCGAVAPKAGKRPGGTQRFRCAPCGKTFSTKTEHDNLFETKQAVEDSKALLALQLLVEGNSVRSTERITGLHRDTICKLLVNAGTKCEALTAEKIRNVPVEDVQAAEDLDVRSGRKSAIECSATRSFKRSATLGLSM